MNKQPPIVCIHCIIIRQYKNKFSKRLFHQTLIFKLSDNLKTCLRVLKYKNFPWVGPWAPLLAGGHSIPPDPLEWPPHKIISIYAPN